MKKLFYLFTAVLFLFILNSCSTESTPVYQLTTNADPAEAGNLTPATGEFEEGESVQITANANEHWVFDRWQGDHTGASNPASFTMSGDKNITAIFTKREYSLNVTIEGEGEVQEQVVQQKSNEYEHETVVELTAEPAEGWRFVRWEGDLGGSENPASIEINQEKSVTAVFERRDYPLTINIEGEGSVAEEVIQAKTTDYPYETLVELTATPVEGWIFVRWEGDATGGENPTQLQVTGDKTVTAVFELDYFALSTSVTGEGVITERLVSGDKATDGSYQFGSVVELTAGASYGWGFSDWSGSLAGQTNPVEITIGTENAVEAVFDRNEYTVTVTQQGEGTVTKSLVSGTETTTGYLYESEVQLTAEPTVGWEFVEWTGDITSTINPESIVVDTSKAITAVFKEIIYPVDLTLDGQGTHSIQVISGTERSGGYLYGTEIEITVAPDAGWNFVYWDGDLQGTNNPIVTTITDSLSVLASLDQSPFAGGNGSEMYPYEISTIEQLQAVRDYTHKHFVQINDIDARVTETWNNGEGFNPIGDNVLPFTGKYNGKHHLINGLYANRSSQNTGLFGIIDGGTIKNINIREINWSGHSNTGGLVGRIQNGVIDSSSVTGSVVANNGLFIGGLIGGAINTIITNSYTRATVIGKEKVGGLIGLSGAIVVDNCFTTGDVTGTSLYYGFVGGLIGMNSGRSEISNSYVSGNIKGEESIGGLIGSNKDGNITNSYSNSTVDGNKNIGGLVGANSNSYENYGVVKTSFSISAVSGNEDVGGLIGLNGASFETSYWDIEKSGLSRGAGRGFSDGATGLTTAQISGTAAQENMPEFDWVNIWITTDSHPILRWQQENN